MKKFKKTMASLMSAAVAVAGLSTVPAMMVGAEEAKYDVFIAIGANQDWSACYAGEDLVDASAEVNPNITVTNAKIGVGDTVTVSLEFAEPIDYTWYMAPVVAASGVTEADFDVELAIDGATVGLGEGDGINWWAEDTGNFTEANGNQAIRLYGGYNEWSADKTYIESPANVTKIEYTITCNSLTASGETAAASKLYKADTNAGNTIDKTFKITDPTEVTFTLAGFGDTTATLGLADASWAYQDWTSSVVVSGDGTYTVTSVDAATAGVEIADGVVVFVVDIPVASEAIKIADTSYVVSDVKVNGEAVNFIYGDIEEKGNVRIEIYNEYGPTNCDETVWTGEAPTAEPEVELAAVDFNGTYNAYIGIQSPTYSFRNAWYDSYGLGTTEFGQITGWEGSDEVVRQGTINDTQIAGNGTYTVSVTDMDLSGDFDSQDYFNLIFVSTDIPNSGEITISDMKLTVDGRNVDINPIVSPDSKEWLTMLIQNIWNDDVKTIGYYNVPPTNVEITFTVSGFAYDKAADDTAVVTSEEAAAGDAEEKGSKTGLVVGIVCGVVAVAGAGIGIGVAQKNKKKKQ